MESALTFITLLIMILIASTVDARPNPSLEVVMKDGSMPGAATEEDHRVQRPEETIEGLLHKGTNSVLHIPYNRNTDDHDCRTSAAAAKRDDHHGKASFKGFEPRPNISAYDDDEKLTELKKPSAGDHHDFEPRPNISAYNNEKKPSEEATAHDHFELRPNIAVYDKGVGLKNVEKAAGKVDDDDDFEPRPNVLIYHD